VGMMPTTLKKTQVWSEAPIRAFLRFQPVCCYTFRQPDIAISGVQILPTQPSTISKIRRLEKRSELPGRRVNGGAKTGHVAAQNQASGGVPSAMARAPRIAGACHGALARRANPVAGDQF
jgi:hypothetical protein